MRVVINGKSYNVKEATTQEEKEKGLQGIDSLPKDEGMLFIYDPPQNVSFTMKEVKFPLDIIFIDEDQIVTWVFTENPGSKKDLVVSDVAYVLELNANSGVKMGDEVELGDDEPPVMKVLFQDGSEQMALWGGERIVSRRETKILISKARKAEEVKQDQAKFEQKCKALGKYMFKVLSRQDNREPEYVKSKNS